MIVVSCLSNLLITHKILKIVNLLYLLYFPSGTDENNRLRDILLPNRFYNVTTSCNYSEYSVRALWGVRTGSQVTWYVLKSIYVNIHQAWQTCTDTLERFACRVWMDLCCIVSRKLEATSIFLCYETNNVIFMTRVYTNLILIRPTLTTILINDSLKYI